MKKIATMMALFVVILTFTSLLTYGANAKQENMGYEAIPLLKDNFDNLNHTTWNALNMSLYNITNGYLYIQHIRNSGYVLFNYALMHTAYKNVDRLSFHTRIFIEYNSSLNNYVNRYYRTDVALKFKDYGMTFTLFGNGKVYVNYIYDSHGDGRTVYSSNFYHLKDNTFVDIYVTQTKTFVKYNIYFENYPLHISGVIQRATDEVGYVTVRLNWWWNSWSPPVKNNPPYTGQVVPELYKTKYTFAIDDVELTGFKDSLNSSTNVVQKNTKQLANEFLTKYGETLFIILAIISILAGGLVEKYGEFLETFGVLLLIFWVISSFTPYLSNINIILGVILSLAMAFLVSAIKQIIDKNENFMESWGLEISFLLFGIFFLGVL